MILTNTTYTLALIITFLYWIFVFPKTEAKEPADAYLNVVVHLFQVNIILNVGQKISKLKTREIFGEMRFHEIFYFSYLKKSHEIDILFNFMNILWPALFLNFLLSHYLYHIQIFL